MVLCSSHRNLRGSLVTYHSCPLWGGGGEIQRGRFISPGHLLSDGGWVTIQVFRLLVSAVSSSARLPHFHWKHPCSRSLIKNKTYSGPHRAGVQGNKQVIERISGPSGFTISLGSLIEKENLVMMQTMLLLQRTLFILLWFYEEQLSGMGWGREGGTVRKPVTPLASGLWSWGFWLVCYIQTGRHFGLQYSNYMCGKSQMTIHPEYSSFSGYCIEKLFQLPCVWRAKSLQSCLTVCNPMDHSLPGSSVHEVLQVRILECVAISFFISCHSQLKRQKSPDCCLLKIIQVKVFFSVLDSGNVLRL